MFSKIIKALFSKKQKAFDLVVKFHKEANTYVEHGTIVASHVKHRLVNQPVRFVFVGLSTPPKLTPALLAFLWDEAEKQGYMPNDLRSYIKDDCDKVKQTASIVSLNAARNNK